MSKPRLVGINHVALEVGDVEEALAFYGRIFAFTLRGKGEGQAFIDLGDQFIALIQAATPHRDRERHFGLVVDDRSAVRERAARAGAALLDGPFLDFLDPWGNRVQVVAYADLQFTKAPEVLRAMGLRLAKSEQARRELAGRRVKPRSGPEANRGQAVGPPGTSSGPGRVATKAGSASQASACRFRPGSRSGAASSGRASRTKASIVAAVTSAWPKRPPRNHGAGRSRSSAARPPSSWIRSRRSQASSTFSGARRARS